MLRSIQGCSYLYLLEQCSCSKFILALSNRVLLWKINYIFQEMNPQVRAQWPSRNPMLSYRSKMIDTFPSTDGKTWIKISKQLRIVL